MTTKMCLAIASVFAVSAGVQAAPLYVNNFEADTTANWTVNNGPGVNSSDFFYDYSSVGIPAAPNGSGTRGLKLQANLNPGTPATPGGVYPAGGTFGGVTVSPNSQNFTGDYVVLFDWWGNYNGPVNGGGNGTTQVSQFGIGTAGTSTQWIGAATKDSAMFAATVDGGSASDFRAYSSVASTSYAAGNAVYAAPGGAINNSSAYYATPFPAGATAPAAQLALYSQQTGAASAGVPSFRWNQVAIKKSGNSITWTVNGTLLATIDASTITLGGGNILFGMSDTNTGASVDPNHPALLFTLIDNVVVVPEPTSLSALALGGLLLSRRRK